MAVAFKTKNVVAYEVLRQDSVKRSGRSRKADEGAKEPYHGSIATVYKR